MNHSQIDDFLLACLRETADATGIAGDGALSQTDWAELLEQALRHGIAPLLYHRLRTFHPGIAIPPDVTAAMRQTYLENAARSVWLYNNLASVLNVLCRNKIQAVALKGAHLAERVYRNRALRYMGDLDLLIRQEDLMKVDALLLEMGCTPTVHNRIVGTDNNEFVYVMPRRDVSLEIHWSILSPLLPYSIDTDGQWARARPARIAGVDALVFCPEDLLLHLCLHAGCTHGFEPGLKLFCDISEILGHYRGDMDWSVVQNRAREWGAEKCVYLTLRLARELLGVPLPQGVLEALRSDDFDERFVVLAREQIFSRRPRTGQPLSMWPAVAGFWAATRLRDKVSLFLKGFFIPRTAMARLYPPPADSIRIYFYYVVRFKDLLRVYGRDVWRWLRRDSAMQAIAREGRDLTSLKTWLASK